MEAQSGWNRLLRKNLFVRFLDILLKGYGQVLICLHPVTGLLVILAILYVSPEIGGLTLLGILSSTLTAFLIRVRRLHLYGGVYGFNGVILAVAWPWFLKLNTASVALLILAASLSSFLMKSLSHLSSRTKFNVPIFSVPAVFLIWGIVAALKAFPPARNLLGPDVRIEEYLYVFADRFAYLGAHFTWEMFFATFNQHLGAAALILLGICVHSRISALFASVALIATLLTLGLGRVSELAALELYLYNTVPCAIALGGMFFVLNRRVAALALLGVFAVLGLTFLGLRYSPLPVFVAPYNFFTIFVVGLLKSFRAPRKCGFYAIPMDFISTPEVGLQWREGERYAERFWRELYPLAEASTVSTSSLSSQSDFVIPAPATQRSSAASQAKKAGPSSGGKAGIQDVDSRSKPCGNDNLKTDEKHNDGKNPRKK